MHRKPLIVRYNEWLRAHGLSFGDALNIALFLLTWVSLVIAGLSAYLAWKTIVLARNGEMTQAKRNEVQLQLLVHADKALKDSSETLKAQKEELHNIQELSGRQLNRLDRAEARAEARPTPLLLLQCGRKGLGAFSKVIDFRVPNPAFSAPHLVIDDDGTVACSIELGNEGGAALISPSLTIKPLTLIGRGGLVLINGNDPDLEVSREQKFTMLLKPLNDVVPLPLAAFQSKDMSILEERMRGARIEFMLHVDPNVQSIELDFFLLANNMTPKSVSRKFTCVRMAMLIHPNSLDKELEDSAPHN
jgi:hypothetical protein